MTVARYWSARANSSEAAARYAEHFRAHVLPAVRALSGFEGAELSERLSGEAVEIVVVTRWSSLEAIRAFAGEDIERAVVAEEAIGLFSTYDARVRHYDVVVATGDGARGNSVGDARVRRYEAFWTTGVARYGLAESERAGGAVIVDLVKNAPLILEEEREVLAEVERRMREAGVRCMSWDAFNARAAARSKRAEQLRAEAEAIASRADLVAFVRALNAHLTAADNAPEEMPLATFLGGLAASLNEASAAGDGDALWRTMGERLLDGLAYWHPAMYERRTRRKR